MTSLEKKKRPNLLPAEEHGSHFDFFCDFPPPPKSTIVAGNSHGFRRLQLPGYEGQNFFFAFSVVKIYDCMATFPPKSLCRTMAPALPLCDFSRGSFFRLWVVAKACPILQNISPSCRSGEMTFSHPGNPARAEGNKNLPLVNLILRKFRHAQKFESRLSRPVKFI